ncbi:HAD family hydrolase [Vibrio rotiferianus]|uniref:phosphoglycolate phosphatase n=1 Tax=Vibrio rotiferianus TaxID=190895 RepID=A0A7Y3ZDL4_9VIBR|nr:HAD hydrolase-like protein [Vibrio rotiferianus]NOH51151.1 HAD family hydrolase [Vibrio rotiferianus]
MKLDAILWDYDDTLVNSAPKNIDITINILSIVAPHLTGDSLPKYLLTEDLYHEANHSAKNWQELYVDYYGLSHDEMLLAGSLWAEHQEKNQTQVELYNGISDAVAQFSYLNHGVCSQNSQTNIRRVLTDNGIVTPFKTIVVYDDVSSENQKPNSFGGVKCLESICDSTNSKLVMYIGDHETETKFAHNLQLDLANKTKVISVAAAYSRSNPEKWAIKPDYVAHNVEDLFSIIGKYV